MQRMRPLFKTEFILPLVGVVIIVLLGLEVFLIQASFNRTVPISSGADLALSNALMAERDLLVRYGLGLVLLVLALFVGLGLVWVRQRRMNQQQNADLEDKITERNALLDKQEAQYRRIVESAHEGILMTNAAYTITYVNPRGAEILGYTPQEMNGKPALEVISPQEIARLSAQAEGASEFALTNGELKVLTKAGEERWLLWSGGPFSADGSTDAGSLFMYTDITANKQAQEALASSEELYRSLIQVMPLSLFRKDCEGRFTFGNERFWRGIGFSEAEGLGKTDYDTAPRELADKYRADDLKIMESGETVELMEELQPAGGGARQTIRVIKSPVRDGLGNVNGIQGMFWDITESRQQAERLREREELLSSVLETVEDGIYIVDQSGKMTYSNKAMERMLGTDRQVIASATYNDPRWQVCTLDGKPFPNEQEPFRQIMATGEPVYDVQQMIRHESGSRVIVSINAAPLHDAQGQLIGEVASMTDITLRKRAEEKLYESQRTLAKAQEIAHIGSWRWDMASGQVEWSDEMYHIFGVEGATFPTTESSIVEKLVHPEDRHLLLEGYARARQGLPTPMEYRILHPDGQERSVWAEGEIMLDAQGTPREMVGVIQDITERKRTEASLRRQKEYLDALHETTIHLMGRMPLHDLLEVITRRAGKLVGTENGYIYLNEAGSNETEMRVGTGLFEQMVGSKAHYGLGASGIVWQSGQPLVIEDYQTWEGRIAKSPGASRLRSLVSIPLKSENEVVGVFGLAHTTAEQKFDDTTVEILSRFAHLASIALDNARLYDAAQKEITERKQAEEKFRILFAASPDAIVLIDPYQPGWPIVDCNEVTCEMNGYTREELIGHTIDILNTSVGTPEERAAYFEKVRREGVMRVEAEHRHKDGHLFPIETSTSLIHLGDSDLILGIDRDVTKRKEVDRLKTEFISTVSHELRTPLTSIRGSLGLIAGGVAGEIPERAKSMVDIAYKNSERLVRLINDILDVEKIESGKMVFQLKPLDIVPLIEQTIESNRSYGEQYHVKYVVTKALAAAMVNVDSDRIIQVLTNLLSNAAKFSRPDSIVEITVQRVDERIRVAVHDHGTGIPEEFKGRIFQKFAQADSSDTRQKGGTGLGLSIVKAIVEKHGGTIGFDTVPGEGTTFYFDLPEYHAPVLLAPVSEFRAPRVLIFEDDHDVALLLRMMLTQGGFENDIAYNRLQARQFLQVNQYAAMTLDLLLPEDDGIDFIHEVRSNEATRDLPIIVVSAKAEQGELQLNGDAVLVADFLQKPIDQGQLLRALQNAVRGRQGKPQILHVEDDSDVLRVVRAILFDLADVTAATRVEEARELLDHTRFDLVILDAILPDGSGIDLLPLLGRNGIQTPVVIFSATENDGRILNQVNASLVKSRTSNEQLLQTIAQLIPGEQRPAVEVAP